MRKKLWILIGLLVVVPGLLFTVSCAKKVVQSEPTVEEDIAAQDAAAEQEIALAAQEQAAQEEAARKWEMQAEEDLRQTQLAEQAAKEAEMERAKTAAMQMFMEQ